MLLREYRPRAASSSTTTTAKSLTLLPLSRLAWLLVVTLALQGFEYTLFANFALRMRIARSTSLSTTTTSRGRKSCEWRLCEGFGPRGGRTTCTLSLPVFFSWPVPGSNSVRVSRIVLLLHRPNNPTRTDREFPSRLRGARRVAMAFWSVKAFPELSTDEAPVNV